ncbi:MAG: hypothetical protein M1441_01705 [Candidatus Parvarchaeota archaeon]|jgi:hypothetical protein|nr:hypothetical protein [Candidatus Parvarchaeota archaeon]
MLKKLKELLADGREREDSNIKRRLYNLVSYLEDDEGADYKNPFEKYLRKIQKTYSRQKYRIEPVLEKFRFYIASAASLSIGISNWSKDFAVNNPVTAPLLNHDVLYSGMQWYSMAFLQEAATIGILAATAKNKKIVNKLAVLYEAASSLNFFLYYREMTDKLSITQYGLEWNTIFFFFQLPVYFLLIRFYKGGKQKSDKY